MDNLGKLKELLRSDYSYAFTCNVGDNRISMNYAWGKKGGVIHRIEAYICGVNPITGKELERGDFLFTFDVANQTAAAILPLYGEYFLRFDAITADGSRIENFCEPFEFELYNSSSRPYIRYSLEKADWGWTKVTVKSNCFARLKGNMWLRCGNNMQRMPAMDSSTLCCYVALNQECAELEVLEEPSLSPLPKPTRDTMMSR